MHPPETRTAVRRSYVFDRLQLTQAAKLHDVSIGAARRWKKEAQLKGDDWAKARAAQSMTTTNMEATLTEMVNEFVIYHRALMDEIQTTENLDATEKVKMLTGLADSFSKCLAAAGRASPRLDRLSFALEILKELSTFTKDRFPEHADAIVTILEPFGQQVTRDHG